MKFNCFHKSCREIAENFCICENEPVLLCENHINSHISSNQSKTHKIMPAFKRVNSDLRGPVIDYFENLIKKNDEMKKKFIKEYQNFIKLSNQILEYFSNFNRLITFIISQVDINIRVLVPLLDGFYSSDTKSSTISNLSELDVIKIKAIEEFKSINAQSHLDLLYTNISDILKDICDYKVNYDEVDMYFFKHNTKELHRFNSIEETIQIYTINSITNQGNLSSICKIDKYNLFVHGGIILSSLDSTYILNTLNLSVQPLPKGIDLCAASAQYFDRKVYIFGGLSNNGIISYSNYFDLARKSWIPIAPLPSICRDTSTILLDQEILISGFKNCMFAYNISTNQYENIKSELLINYYNLLIFFSDVIYLLASPNLYVCLDWKGGRNWTLINSGLLFDCTTSKPCINGKYAYFSTCAEKIHRFDCESGTLTTINNF